MGPLVSVIVPTHLTDPPFLREAIAAVVNQTYAHWEMIVVDDGSRSPVLDEIVAVDARVKLVRGPKQGIAGSRNLGAQHISGQFVAFLDSDDLWYPDRLSVLIDELLKSMGPSSDDGSQPSRAHTVAAWSNLDVVQGPEALLVKPGRPAGQPISRYAILSGGERPSVNGSLFPRWVVDKLGGFDTSLNMGEDVDYIFRSTELGNFAPVAPIMGAYRVHQGNTTGDVVSAGAWYDKMLIKHLGRAKAAGDAQAVKELRLNRRKAKSYYCLADTQETLRAARAGELKRARQALAASVRLSPSRTVVGLGKTGFSKARGTKEPLAPQST
jgi:glycosyltransferase involved in cell wall biosynthesis